ncbi:MAG: 50S ribosomal protein L10, partial [Candidatus Woesearchaeota archaeon]
NVEGLPSGALQKMRFSLRKDNVKIIMTKRRLIKVALEKCGKTGAIDLIPHLKGMPALILTNENPFKLFKQLERSKSQGPAKAGQIAPNDVLVKAGPTPFAPGPIIGELGAVGIKAGINGGKVEIKADVTVLKEGKAFTAQLASILSRLMIFPMEIGLNLTAACEDGLIYDKTVLSVDEKQYIENISACAAWAMNLSIEAKIYNKDNIEVFITKASQESINLAMDAPIYAKEIIDNLIGKANAQMLSVSENVPDECK